MTLARIALAGVGLVGAALLGGCSEMHSGFESIGRPFSAQPAQVSADEPAAAQTPAAAHIPVVRRSAAVSQAIPDAPPVRVAAVPGPREIFDFHAGVRADGWRQPFVIDPNDGPLAADVRKTSTELREFMAQVKAQPKTDARRCGETDVAHATPGCAARPKTARAGGDDAATQ